jgi:hypothetical protein
MAAPGSTALVDVDAALLDDVVNTAILAADNAVIGHTFPTRADEIRTAVHAAFRLAARNGLVTLTPREQWPEWIALTGDDGEAV